MESGLYPRDKAELTTASFPSRSLESSERYDDDWLRALSNRARAKLDHTPILEHHIVIAAIVAPAARHSVGVCPDLGTIWFVTEAIGATKDANDIRGGHSGTQAAHFLAGDAPE